MESLSERIRSLEVSATMEMNRKGKELKEKGVDVINLSVGEPDFNTPDFIKKAAIDAIEKNFSFYPPAPGFPELRKAISEKFKRENNLEYTTEQIVVSVGAKNSLANAILCLIDKEDEVIVPAPYWVTYTEQVKLAEGKSIVINGSIDNNFKVTPEQIENAITSKTKAILLCSPSNPTGAIYSFNELQAIVKVLEKHPRIFVITDEIYEHINFVGRHISIAEFESVKDRVVVINGVSKAYAMTGYRIGYMAAPLWISNACIKLQGQLITGATTIAMKAAEAALKGDQSCVTEMNKAFLRRRDLVINLIRDIPDIKCPVPDGAFYIFPQVSKYYGKSANGKIIKSSGDMALYLLDQAHIATVPGDAFGDDDCIRISYATSDDKLTEAMKRMSEALHKLS